MELDKMKDAVHSIKMTQTMKSRIKKNCTRTITKKEKASQMLTMLNNAKDEESFISMIKEMK